MENKNNKSIRLSFETVLLIKADLEKGMMLSVLANKYSTSVSIVRNIYLGKTYRRVPAYK